ncbi:MAG: hypothetical protein P8R54_26865 [Myxococcota bacterium]|nr:hypothetical protein [Myxococcota bacterium]
MLYPLDLIVNSPLSTAVRTAAGDIPTPALCGLLRDRIIASLCEPRRRRGEAHHDQRIVLL